MSPCGTSRTSGDVRRKSVKWAKADLIRSLSPNRDFMSNARVQPLFGDQIPRRQVDGTYRGQAYIITVAFAAAAVDSAQTGERAQGDAYLLADAKAPPAAA